MNHMIHSNQSGFSASHMLHHMIHTSQSALYTTRELSELKYWKNQPFLTSLGSTTWSKNIYQWKFGISTMLHHMTPFSQSSLSSTDMLNHMTKHYSPGSSRGSLRAQTPLAPWYGYGIPWSFLLWNRGEPRKLFLIVCSRDFHGVFWTPGEVGGVGLGLCDGVPRLCFGLSTGEPLGLLDDRLAFLLER